MEIEENLVESPFKSPAPPYLVPSAPVTPNNPPWTAFTAIGVWIVSVFLILMIPGLFLLPYLAAQSSQITDTNEIIEFAKTDTIAVLIQIAAILPAHLLTLAVVWLIATRFRKFKLRDTLGFDKGGFAWWHYLVILGGFFVIAAVVGAFFPEQENDLVRILKSSRWAVYFVAFVATFTAPVVEEFVYRGVVYSAFQRALGIPAAVLFVTFLFAFVHVPQYYPSISTIFLLTLLSLILTLVRVKTNNLLPCIILHTVFNGFQSFLLILEPFITDTSVPDPATIVHFLR